MELKKTLQNKGLVSLFLAAGFILLLAGCIGSPENTPTSPGVPIQQSNTQAITETVETAPPSATTGLQETAIPIAETLATETAASIQPTETVEAAQAEGRLYNGIQQGVTDDGFPYLGNPDAPVTLTDYSDFL